MEKCPFVSIVVPFKRVNDWVIESVTHIVELDYPSFELILVPDFQIDIPVINKRIKIVVSGEKNISEKRNIGAAASDYRAVYFGFVDSDAYPERDWLKKGLSLLYADPLLGAVGGPQITPRDESVLRRIAGNVKQSFLCSGGNAYKHRMSNQTFFCDELSSCNMVVNAEAFKDVGGFDTTYETGEDIKLCQDLIENGRRLKFDGTMIVFHHRRKIFLDFYRQVYYYSLTIPRLLILNRKLGNLLSFLPFLTTFFWLGSIPVAYYFSKWNTWTVITSILFLNFIALITRESIVFGNKKVSDIFLNMVTLSPLPLIYSIGTAVGIGEYWLDAIKPKRKFQH